MHSGKQGWDLQRFAEIHNSPFHIHTYFCFWILSIGSRSVQTWQGVPGILLSDSNPVQILLGRLKTVSGLLGYATIQTTAQSFTQMDLTGTPQAISEASWSDTCTTSVGLFQCRDLKVTSTRGSSLPVSNADPPPPSAFATCISYLVETRALPRGLVLPHIPLQTSCPSPT